MPPEVVNPEAELAERDGDVDLTDEQALQISLFKGLKSAPSLSKFPGAWRLRRLYKGDVVCRQGEAGWTAFYVLTSEDIAMIIRTSEEVGAWRPGMSTGAIELADVQKRIDQIEQSKTVYEFKMEEKLRRVATVHLAIPRSKARQRPGLLSRLFGGGSSAKRSQPLFIPIDGPRDVEYSTMQSSINEGDLFGEMSCLYRTPRSATIVCDRDCYMLELLRNILDHLQKDPVYKAKMDETYKNRILQMHLRNLSLFADLSDEQFEAIKKGIELVTVSPGQIIFDEYDRPDAAYIIRSGLVKVVKKTSALLHQDNVRSWGGFCTALKEGEGQPGTPRGKIWQLLNPALQTMLKEAANNQLTPEQRRELLFELNEKVIKVRATSDLKELQPVATAAEFKEGLKKRMRSLPDNKKVWTEQDYRCHNRALLEAIFSGIIRNFYQRVGPECVLSYSARGDFLGEMGLLAFEPRTASLIGFSHPAEGGRKDSGRVELVKIPRDLFRQLIEANPVFRAKVEAETAKRARQAKKLAQQSIADEGGLQFSDRFEKLGLIQGQKLMLIDLNRCTRCDECVRACVNTHDDGRSRLFLDGPRFNNYLVPVTCRSCLDPVCMIGCPVASIHRGDLGQMIIENWCIGCGLCAKQCPYGSIQMYDIGIIPEQAMGWRYAPARSVKGNEWVQPRFKDRDWLTGNSPFRFDKDFQFGIASWMSLEPNQSTFSSMPVCFRLEFNLAADVTPPDGSFKLELSSPDENAQLWINGQELKSTEKLKRGKREYPIPPKEGPAGPWLRAGRNVIAVRVLPAGLGDTFMAVRLDAILKAASGSGDDVTQKLVMEQAVVCDLCSGLRSGPACVSACPHEAALRVDARFEFPGMAQPTEEKEEEATP